MRFRYGQGGSAYNSQADPIAKKTGRSHLLRVYYRPRAIEKITSLGIPFGIYSRRSAIMVSAAYLLALAPVAVLAQSPVWGQCKWNVDLSRPSANTNERCSLLVGGGIGYSGPTTCASGSTCQYSK